MKENTKENRNRNYDFVRVICTIAVILIHVSSSYKNAYLDADELGRLYKDNLLSTCIYNLLPRFAVPCFVMLSGAFTLADNRNLDYKSFYLKKMKKIGIPTLIFSCGYSLFNMLLLSGGGAERCKDFSAFRERDSLLSYVVYVYDGRYLFSDAINYFS